MNFNIYLNKVCLQTLLQMILYVEYMTIILLAMTCSLSLDNSTISNDMSSLLR